MAGNCGSCGGGRRPITFPTTSGGSSASRTVSAVSKVFYEVVDQRGQPTGRTFSSLTAASDFARRINGTTREVA